MKNYYSIIGVDANANIHDIKKKYKRLAVQYHPDKNKSSDANEKFIEISEAYAVLSDPIKKAEYDYSMQHKADDNMSKFQHRHNMSDAMNIFNLFNNMHQQMNAMHANMYQQINPNVSLFDFIPTYEQHLINHKQSYSYSYSSTTSNGATTIKTSYQSNNGNDFT